MEKSSWVIPKVVAVAYGSGRLRELFITKFKSQFKRGFTKEVVTRAVTRVGRKDIRLLTYNWGQKIYSLTRDSVIPEFGYYKYI